MIPRKTWKMSLHWTMKTMQSLFSRSSLAALIPMIISGYLTIHTRKVLKHLKVSGRSWFWDAGNYTATEGAPGGKLGWWTPTQDLVDEFEPGDERLQFVYI